MPLADLSSEHLRSSFCSDHFNYSRSLFPTMFKS